ncbi:MAG: TIGR03067 domain-containing protein [Singulisphaera sp.]
MITRRSVCLAVVFLTALAMPSLADEAADKEARRLDGTWKFLSLESDGDKAPEEVIQKWRWVIRDKVLTIPGEGKSSLEVDPSKTPKALDMTSLEGKSKGKSFECIYKLDEDRLTICFPEGKQDSRDKARPKEFDGGPGKSLIVLERIEDE